MSESLVDDIEFLELEQETVCVTVEEEGEVSETVQDFDSEETTCLTGDERQDAFSVLESFKIQQISGTEASQMDSMFDQTMEVLPSIFMRWLRNCVKFQNHLCIILYNRSLSIAKDTGQGGMGRKVQDPHLKRTVASRFYTIRCLRIVQRKKISMKKQDQRSALTPGLSRFIHTIARIDRSLF